MALTTNLESYWKLDESSGNAADSAGSNTLTNHGSIAYSAAKINNGAALASASSRYFNNSSPTGIPPSSAITIAMWVKFTSTGSTVCLASKIKNGGSNNTGFQWLYQSSGSMLFQYSNADPGSTTEATASWSPSTATWYYIAVVVDASTHTITFYVNGSPLTTSYNSTAATSIGNPTSSFSVGARDYSGTLGLYIDGTLDEIGLWSRALSGSEISQLYNSGAGLQYPFSTSVTATPSVATGALSVPTPTISAVKNVTVAPAVASTAASIPAPSVSTGVTVATNAFSATFSIPAPAVSIPNVVISPSAIALTASVQTPSIATDYVVEVAALVASMGIPAPTISAELNALVAMSALSLSLSVLTPPRIGGLWQNAPRASSSLTNAPRASSSLQNEARPNY